MSSNKFKVIWDAVHGQISVSNIICNTILDNEYFQRLKRLEQTNTRPLYPCAHHDRFIHSLGTYHLGKIVFEAIKLNSEGHINEHALDLNIENSIEWTKLMHEFELACLLHDVGHAPFSHTFEGFFDIDLQTKKSNFLDNYLLNKDSEFNYEHINEHLGSLQDFQADYEKVVYSSSVTGPSPHEKVSAFLVLTKFSKALSESFKADPFNVARMILGVKFQKAFSEDKAIKEQVYNCFIELLNGSEIDVDKIDYLVRDQWATGNVFKKIDYDRLLSSAYIVYNNQKKILSLCFHKKAINEIIGIKEAKHSLTSNIHNHPVVKYDDYLLQKAVNQSIKFELHNLSDQLDEEIVENYVANIVSVKALMKPIDFAKSIIFLPTDDDLIHYIKKNFNSSHYAKEWLSRSYRLKALWKSPFDFNHIFHDFTEFEHRVFYQKIELFTKRYIEQSAYLKIGDLKKPYYIHDKNINNFSVFKLKSDLDILMNIQEKEIIQLTKLLNNVSKDTEDNANRKYFLLFLANPYLNKTKNADIEEERIKFIPYIKGAVRQYFDCLKSEIIEVLNSHPGSRVQDITHYFQEYKNLNSDNEIIEFEQTLLLYFTHLDNSKIIQHVIEKQKGKDVTPDNPKKGSIKIFQSRISIAIFT